MPGLAHLRRFGAKADLPGSKAHAEEGLGMDLSNTVYALDSTTIDLCPSLFPWASFRSTKAAVKMHMLLDLRGKVKQVSQILKAISTPGKTGRRRYERLGSGSEPPGDEAAEGLGQGGGCHRRDADVLLIPPGVPDTDQYQQPTGTDHAGDPETVTGRSDRH